MAFLTFEPKIQAYQPANRLLAPANVNQASHSAPTRRLADEEHPTYPHPRLDIKTTYQYSSEGGSAPYPPERAVIAEQIMTAPVISMTRETPLAEARKLFREHRFRHVPIVTKEKQIIGIISDRDLLHHPGTDLQQPVSELAVERVIVATPDTEIREIAAIFFQQRIGAMPIINSSEKLIGIITRSDILRTVVRHAPLEIWI